VTSFVSYAHKQSLSPSHRPLPHLKTHQILFRLRGNSVHTGGCHGPRGSPVMQLNPQRLTSRSSSMGFQPLLPLQLACLPHK
jgi:hypothetical protein